MAIDFTISKKLYSFLFLTFALFYGLISYTQTQYNVNGGNKNNSTYNDLVIGHSQGSVSQIIYTTSQLTSSGMTSGYQHTITSLKFKVYAGVGGYSNLSCQIFMQNHSSASHSNNTFTPFDQVADKVYETRPGGELNWMSSGWKEIILDQPFIWDGSSNILVTINKISAIIGGTPDMFNYSTSYPDQVLCASEGQVFDVNDQLNWVPGGLHDELPSFRMMGTCTGCPDNLLMTSSAYTGCNAIIKDDGGDSNYGSNRSDEIILTPSSGAIQLAFSSFEVEGGSFDYLHIYQDDNGSWTPYGL